MLAPHLPSVAAVPHCTAGKYKKGPSCCKSSHRKVIRTAQETLKHEIRPESVQLSDSILFMTTSDNYYRDAPTARKAHICVDNARNTAPESKAK